MLDKIAAEALVSIANYMDENGMRDEASRIDEILKQADARSMGRWWGEHNPLSQAAKGWQ